VYIRVPLLVRRLSYCRRATVEELRNGQSRLGINHLGQAGLKIGFAVWVGFGSDWSSEQDGDRQLLVVTSGAIYIVLAFHVEMTFTNMTGFFQICVSPSVIRYWVQ
jgi:hypothetical protein